LVIPEQPRNHFILACLIVAKHSPCSRSTSVSRTMFRCRLVQQFALRLIEADCTVSSSFRNSSLHTGSLGHYERSAPPACWAACEPCHLQRINHQTAIHIRPHRPAHNLAAEQVDHDSKKQPAFFVAMYVKSPPCLVGAQGVKLRFRRFGAIGKLCLLSVVSRETCACREPECRASASAVAHAACLRRAALD